MNALESIEALHLTIADRQRLIDLASGYGQDYLAGMDKRRIVAEDAAIAALRYLGGPLTAEPNDSFAVLEQLHSLGSPATVVNAGGRYFGFVNGGALPVAVGANILAATWDQNAAMRVQSPIAAVLEDHALNWVKELLHIAPECAGALVTGATMANFTCLAAARHALLAEQGWDVDRQGLFGAPEIPVIIGAEAHASLRKSLALVGFGRDRVIEVPTDAQGRMSATALPQLPPHALICIQAGNVNTGSFDPALEICKAAQAAGAWVHVDGAFGLWAAASSRLQHLTRGFENADSWATDAHKWLNVPYDCGIALVRRPEPLRAAMALSAAYLVAGDQREAMNLNPECSRRARGVELWSVIRTLGRDGVEQMIDRTCRHAKRFADGLQSAGFTILNEVVINQVLVSFGNNDVTRRVIAAVQEEGTCWCGATLWHGHAAMRISVCSWATTEQDVERSLSAILFIAHSQTAG